MQYDMKKEAIRIGTLVKGGPDLANYIGQILPHGFESFSITFWQTAKGIDFKKLAREVNETLSGSGAVITTVSIYGNALGDEAKDKETLQGWKDCIDNAHLFGCDLVTGFTGRVRGKSVPDSMPAFKKVFAPLAKRAEDKGMRLAFENCDMGGTWQSGDWNIAHTPTAWEMMFDAVPGNNLGLEWEPCHQMVKLIDPMPQLRKWVKKIFHVHGKDATIYWDVVKEHGIHGSHEFAFHRTPGFGDSNWTNIISELRRGGFKGSIDIEGWHDPVYRNELEMTGQVHALNHLKQCRGGNFVENPK
jgi:sugar phosphate isomerase/epimerase